MSNPGTPPTPRPEALKKLAQLRIERLKKEEEEEQWISGEELYTEGSSDEDDVALRAKRKANEKGLKKSSRIAGNKPKKHTKEEKLKFQNHLLPPDFNLPSCSDSAETSSQNDTGKDEKNVVCNEQDSKSGDTLASSSTANDDEVPAEISWRPKRGLLNQSLTPVDAEQAYLAVIGKMRKLKELLADESSIFLHKSQSQTDSHHREKNSQNVNPNEKINIHSLLTSNWNFLQKKCDLESAFSNMNILDQLLEIIDQKKKEARMDTLNVQLQISDELSQLCYSQESTNDEIAKNTNSFLQFCRCTQNKDNAEDTKSLVTKKGQPNAECNIEHQNLIKICEGTDRVKIKPLEIIKKTFNSDNKTKKYQTSVVISEENFVEDNFKDNMPMISFTNDEEKRLTLLLEDSDSQMRAFSEICDTTSITHARDCRRPVTNDAYPLNKEAKLMLETIDENLKVFSRTQNENEFFRSISSLPHYNNDLLSDKSEPQEMLQLCKIDALLKSLKEPSYEEIQPLTNKQITTLVNISVAKDENFVDERSHHQPHVQSLTGKGSTDIKKLVLEAKSYMPHFKFKHPS